VSEPKGVKVSAAGHRLDVWHSRSDNSEVIKCRGWLDSETCDSLQALIEAAIDSRVERLRLDLSNLLGLDESGHRCLQRTSERCERDGIFLEIIANRPILRAIHEHSLGDRPFEEEG
jgi:anti-anti-sigma regulatory factor